MSVQVIFLLNNYKQNMMLLSLLAGTTVYGTTTGHVHVMTGGGGGFALVLKPLLTRFYY